MYKIFKTVLNKIKNYISQEDEQLIGKSIQFAFSQDEHFIKEYITIFLDETCNAYTGENDNTSCVKGIIERFVLGVGKTVEIICTPTCNNPVYQKLNDLMNKKFLLEEEARHWFTEKAETETVKRLSKEERKKHFINYLINKAKQEDTYNEEINKEIKKYADNIDYSFENLQIGGKKQKRKTVKKYKKIQKNKKSLKKITKIKNLNSLPKG